MEKYLSDVSKKDTMERSFETTIVNFVKKGLTNDQITYLDNLLNQSDKASHSERFVAFFTLFSLYRREVNNEAIKELFSKYRQDFVDEPLFTHIDLLRLTMISHSKDDLKHIMEKSKKYIHDLEHSLGEGKLQHTGILHFYASAVCSYYEVSDYNYRSDDLSKDVILYENILLAKEVIDICIKNEKHYAKFYATKGRIKLLTKDFDEAIDNFLLAKAKEDPLRKDYRLIIGGYQDYILFAKQLKQADILMEQNKKMENAIKATHSGNIRLISLFTGLITLVIGNLSVITSNDEPVKLMFILNGMFFVFFGIIIVFTNLLLGYDDNEKQAKGLRFLSAVLILAGLILLGWFFYKEMV